MEKLDWLKAKLSREGGSAPTAADVARTRGWDWRGDLGHDGLLEVGPDFEFGADDVAVGPGQPLVVCGSNSRTRHDDRLRCTSGENFVAVRTGVDLPRLRTRSKLPPPEPTGLQKAAAGVLTAGLAVQTVMDVDTYLPPYGRDKGIKLPKKATFELHGDQDRRGHVQALVSDEAMGILRWFSLGFNIETSDDWLIAWAYGYDLITPDPALWAWLESGASALIDLARVWAAGPGFGQDWPLYNTVRPGRPDVPVSSFKWKHRSRLD